MISSHTTGMVFSPRRREMVTTAEIVEDITGAEPVLLVHHMRPTILKLTCRNHHDGTGWQVDVTITGPRIRKDGSDGADVTEYVGMVNRVNPDRTPPEWIARRVAVLVATLPGQPATATTTDPDPREHAAANEKLLDIIQRRMALRNSRPPLTRPQGTHTDALAALYAEQAKLYDDSRQLFRGNAILYTALGDAASYNRGEARSHALYSTLQRAQDSTGDEIEVDESAAVQP